MTSQTKLWALSAGALALSLALAGCGGGGSGSSPAAAVSGGGGGGGTTTTAEGALTLPAGHGLAAGDHSIDAGMSLKVAGTRFRCYGTEDCTVTVTGEGDAVAATHTGMVGAYALDATATRRSRTCRCVARPATNRRVGRRSDGSWIDDADGPRSDVGMTTLVAARPT